MSTNFTDKQLVEKVQKSAKKNFGFLVIKYQQRIIHLVFRFVGNFSDAQDIVQETFLLKPIRRGFFITASLTIAIIIFFS